MTDELDHARDDEAVPQPSRARTRARSEADPLNRALTIAALVMVVVIVGVLGYAVYATMRPAQQPRTAVERQVLVLETEIKTNPKNVVAWIDYLQALLVGGQNTKAIAVANEGVSKFEDKAPFIELRAEAEYALGRKDAALATAGEALKVARAFRKKTVDEYWQDKVVRVRPPDSEAIVDAELLRARIYVERSLTEKAIASYTVALAEDPRMADVLTMRGEAYLTARETAKARLDFTEALKYDPTNADALAGLARTKGESK
jgi:tetratricopeptide (TPR) repeat protein